IVFTNEISISQSDEFFTVIMEQIITKVKVVVCIYPQYVQQGWFYINLTGKIRLHLTFPVPWTVNEKWNPLQLKIIIWCYLFLAEIICHGTVMIGTDPIMITHNNDN